VKHVCCYGIGHARMLMATHLVVDLPLLCIRQRLVGRCDLRSRHRAVCARRSLKVQPSVLRRHVSRVGRVYARTSVNFCSAFSLLSLLRSGCHFLCTHATVLVKSSLRMQSAYVQWQQRICELTGFACSMSLAAS